MVLNWTLYAQSDSSHLNHKRLRSVVVGTSAAYATGLLALNHVWYKDTERQSFRFFNDNAEWKQLDKFGHFYSSYYLSYTASKALAWCQMGQHKASINGALAGFLMTVPIEILDGFSDGYGASAGDIVADAAGPAFFLAQALTWKEIRIHPKFSFHRTPYPALRPALLGDNLFSEVVKDYNGQTYWLSFDIDKFVPFPKWLNLGVGHGAKEMIYARDGQNREAGLDPYRQYFFAIDFDITAIRTRSKVIKTLVFLVNAIKLPAPTLEVSRKGSRFHAFYW